MLLEANNRPARLSCAVVDAGSIAAVSQSLREGGFEALPGRWLQTTLALSGWQCTMAEAFRQGKITLQDEASQMVAHLVDARRANRSGPVLGARGHLALRPPPSERAAW